MPLPSFIKDLFYTNSLPSLGSERRDDSLDLAKCEGLIENALKFSGTEQQALIQSALLLWHDHLEASHEISQCLNSKDGSFLHALMHRRESDFPNAKYWINQTGQYRAYSEIAKRSKILLKENSLPNLLTGEWNPYAMVDSVEHAKPNTQTYKTLQKIQQIEMEVLIEKITLSHP